MLNKITADEALRGRVEPRNTRQWIWYLHSWLETKVHVLHYVLMLSRATDNSCNEWNDEQLSELHYRVKKVRKSLLRTFSDH